ncbi:MULTISPECIES: hypothetical protein [Aeromonas]|uniref:hypothetical protein n=1 Tax=Aeromonas TaxID=642 RepID=UPI002B052389|nr:hypothetical protein [Aeromonas jandaei]
MSNHTYGLAMKSSTGVETLLLLTDDPDSAVRRAVAINPISNEAVLRKLAGDSASEVRNAVIGHHSAPDDVILGLLSGASLAARCSLAQKPKLSLKVIEALFFDGNENVLSRLGRNEATPNEILSKLGAHSNPEIRAAVACNPVCSIELLMSLSNDPDSKVVGKAASNLSMPSWRLDELARLDGDKFNSIKLFIANNPSAESRTLMWLFDLSSKKGMLLRALCKHQNFPFELKLKVALLNENPKIVEELRSDISLKSDQFWMDLASGSELFLSSEIAHDGNVCSFGDALINAGMVNVFQIWQSVELAKSIDGNQSISLSNSESVPVNTGAKRLHF